MLHHIRKSILNTLATADSKRYGELKPDNLDGNVFTYHLKQLITGKYVTKQDDGSYALLPRGKDYIVHRYENSALSAHSIFLIILKVGDKWLLRERHVQPLLGRSGFVHGEPKHNEDIITTAQKRLMEKTGLNVDLAVRASGLVKISENGELQSFSHAIILTGHITDLHPDDFIVKDKTGKNFLTSETDMQSLQLLPSCHDIMQAIQSDQGWFELSYDIG